MRILLTTTWNSEDVIGTFLQHYRRLGFDQIVVMDFDSTDCTRDILTDPGWQGFVSIFPFPGIERLDSSNLMLADARRSFPPETLGLFCDPDELLVLPLMDAARDLPLDLGDDSASGWVFPRSNMTCRKSTVMAHQDEMQAFGALRYRADGAIRGNHVALIKEERLEPAWIFTRLPGKVLVKLAHAKAIGDGDHTASTTQALTAAPEGFRILHYPFRTLQAFRKKIAIAEQDFAVNTHLPAGYGWQLRRWIKLAQGGDLSREYFDQFPDDADFDRHLAEGSLEEDLAIVRFHSHIGTVT
jgi:hypothetical protein